MRPSLAAGFLVCALFLQGCGGSGGGGSSENGSDGGRGKCPVEGSGDEHKTACTALCGTIHSTVTMGCSSGMTKKWPSEDAGSHCTLHIDSPVSEQRPYDCTDLTVPDGCTVQEVARTKITPMGLNEWDVVCQFQNGTDASGHDESSGGGSGSGSGSSVNSHYEKPPCGSDEVTANVKTTSGETGTACFPHAKDGKCPTDVPSGVTAHPETSSKDPQHACFLSCSKDSECGDAKCLIGTGSTGVCAYPSETASTSGSGESSGSGSGESGSGGEHESTCAVEGSGDEHKNACTALCGTIHSTVTMGCSSGMTKKWPSEDPGDHCTLHIDSPVSEQRPYDCTDLTVPDGCTVQEVVRKKITPMGLNEWDVVCQFHGETKQEAVVV